MFYAIKMNVRTIYLKLILIATPTLETVQGNVNICAGILKSALYAYFPGEMRNTCSTTAPQTVHEFAINALQYTQQLTETK